MEKAVVTGALEFIGFHLCQRLLEEGVEVTAIDDLSDSQQREEKEENLNYFGRNALFTFWDQKIEDVSIDKSIKGTDVCFHLAVAMTDRRSEELQERIDEVVDALYAAAETSVSDVFNIVTLRCN